MKMFTQARITTLFYDWDNTFVNSEAILRLVKKNIFTEYLMEVFPAALPLIEKLETEGRDFGDVCRSLVGQIEAVHNFQLDMPIEKLRIEKLRPAVIAASPQVELTQGTAQYVQETHGSLTQAIVSNSPVGNIFPVLERHSLDKIFPQNMVFGAPDHCPQTPKPSPSIYIHAMNILGVSPSECATYEDSATGVQAAKEAGIGTIIGYIGLVLPEHREQAAKELKAHGATKVSTRFILQSGFSHEQYSGPIAQGLSYA